MNYYIKEITKEDIRDYLTVNTKSWVETYKGIISDEFLEKIVREHEENIKRLEDKFDDTKINEPDYKRYLLYVDNKPVGNMAICKSRYERYSNSGELCTLYLLNKLKKKGYGKLLFDYAVEELINQGYEDMIIYCLKDNPTNEFYKHMGGKLIETQSRIIGEKELEENIYYYENLKKGQRIRK